MQVGVRWVYQQVIGPQKRPMEAGQRPTLCFKGQEYMFGISVGYPVHVIKRQASDFDTLRVVMNGNTKEEWPIDAAVHKLEEIAQTHGITLGASRLLARALVPHASLGDEDKFADEEEELMSSETVNLNPDEEGEEISSDESEETRVVQEGPEGAAPTAPKKTSKPKKPQRAKVEQAKGVTKVNKNTKVDTKPSKPVKTKAVAKLPKAKSAGPTPFRVGTGKEKAFLQYKEEQKKVDAMDKGKKKEWCEKVAKKLGLSASTIASWVGGQFSAALKK